MRHSKAILLCLLAAIFIFGNTEPSFANREGSLLIETYGTPDCRYCQEIDELLSDLLQDSSRITLSSVNIRSSEGKAEFESLQALHEIPLVIPTLVANKTQVYVGYEESLTFIRQLEAGNEDSIKDPGSDRSVKITIPAILAAGLLDGINPCAIAMLLFLISYLGVLKRNNHHVNIWKAGFMYVGATFATYYLIGVGILSFLLYLSIIPLMSEIIQYLTIVFCLGLATVNIIEYRRRKCGENPGVNLKLPESWRRMAHRLMRRTLSSGSIYAGAIFLGTMVSLIDFLCTGQVYLPTIALMLTGNPDNWLFHIYLGLYNLMFVLPMVLIVLAAHKGKTAQSGASLLTRYKSHIQLCVIVFYITLAIYMIVNK